MRKQFKMVFREMLGLEKSFRYVRENCITKKKEEGMD